MSSDKTDRVRRELDAMRERMLDLAVRMTAVEDGDRLRELEDAIGGMREDIARVTARLDDLSVRVDKADDVAIGAHSASAVDPQGAQGPQGRRDPPKGYQVIRTAAATSERGIHCVDVELGPRGPRGMQGAWGTREEMVALAWRHYDVVTADLAAELATLRQLPHPVLDALAQACGCPEWHIPNDLVREVRELVAERDRLSMDFIRASSKCAAAEHRANSTEAALRQLGAELAEFRGDDARLAWVECTEAAAKMLDEAAEGHSRRGFAMKSMTLRAEAKRLREGRHGSLGGEG